MAQSKTKFVTWTFILKSKPFAQGVADRRAGKPFAAEYERMGTRDQNLYELGRQFGAFAPATMEFKRGIHVNRDAVRVMHAACN